MLNNTIYLKQTKKYTDEYKDKGINRTDRKRLGAKKAQMELSNKAALHNQDMVAGGYDAIGTLSSDGTRQLGSADFGHSDTNSHIGSQWNGERIKLIDEQACQAQKEGNGKEKMNVELRACGKKEAKANGCNKAKK